MFASQRLIFRPGGGSSTTPAGWALGSATRGERAATFLPSASPAASSSPSAPLWGARPAVTASGGAPTRQGAILLSRERTASPTPTSPRDGDNEEENGTTKNESEEKNESDEEVQGQEEEREKAGATATAGEQLLDVSEETEKQREPCPDGVDCRSEDPRHFILFLHTARDEFAEPSASPPALFRNRSILFTSSFDALQPITTSEKEMPPNNASNDALTAKRALLRRSTSFDSGLKREISFSSLGGGLAAVGPSGSSDNSEKSGWLHKRAALRKNWVCYWFVLRPQTRQLLYYKARADTTAQGKGPEGSVWLDDASTLPAPESDDRAHCFRLCTPRKTLQLSALDEESKWSWIRAITVAASRGMKSPPSGDQSPLVFGKGLKASGNGSLFDFSTSFRQLPEASRTPGGEEADKQHNAERERQEKKRKEKKKREKEKNYAKEYGRKIDWTGRDLKVLPEKLYEFANFDGLTKLVVRANQLSAFPGELSMLRGLTYLDYSENLIKELPKEMGAMYRLKELYLESNRLERLPPELGKLTRLRVLNIGNGQDWYNVVEAQRSANKIRSLPDEIAQLAHLRSFDCSNNAISAIPPGFFDNCTKLVKLDLTGNQIVRLPGSLGRLVQLEKLLVSHNKIEELPPQVGWLRQLKLLHLVDNKLSRLPPQVGHCSRLEQLYMEDNPIKDPPRHVFKLELTELLLYLSDLGKGEEQCFRTRVVLFGDEDKDKLFKAIAGRGATAGESLAIATTTLKIKHGLLPAGVNPTLDVWSFASELSRPMLDPEALLSRLFMTDEVVVVLAIRFDAIDADTLAKWFAMLRANSPRSPVVVLACAAQPFPPAQHREIVADLKAKCDRERGDLNVALVDLLSVKGNKDLKALVPVLVDIALRHVRPMGRPVQRGLHQLEQILGSSCVDTSSSTASLPTLLLAPGGSDGVQGPVMGMDAWAELCALCGVATDEQQAHALKVLASWGVLVHVPAGMMAKEAFIVPSAPWLLAQLTTYDAAS